MTEKNKENIFSGSITGGVLWSFLGSGLPLIVAIITIPILIRELGTARFGLLTLAWTIVGYFSLFDIGLGRALTQLVSEKLGLEQECDVPGIVWTSLILMFLLGLIGTVTLFCVSPLLVKRVLKIPPELLTEALNAFYLLSISIPIVISTAGVRGILVAYQKFKIVNYIRIPIGVLSYLGPIIVLPFSNNLFYVIGSLVMVKLLSFLAYGWFSFKINPELRTSFGFRREMIPPLLSFGGWITVSSVIGPLLVNIDRFILGAFVSITAVAYYSTPFDIVKQLLILPGALLTVLFPVFSSTYIADRDYTVKLFQRSVKYVFLGMFPLTLLIIAFAKEGLTLWVGQDFSSNSFLVMQIIVVGIFINSLGYVPHGLIQGSSRPDITAKLHLIELPFYLLAMGLLVSTRGIIGAAIAWTGRVLLDTVFLFIMAERIMPNKIIQRLIPQILCAFLIFLAAAEIRGLWGRVAFSVGIIFGFLFITWQWLLENDERGKVKRYLRLLVISSGRVE